MIVPYLQVPQEAHQLTFECIKTIEFYISKESYIKSGVGENAQRNIFSNVEYDDFEKEHLVQFKQAVLSEKLQLPTTWNDAQALKFLYSGGFKLNKAIENVKKHLQWLETPYYHTLTPKSEKMLIDGIIYQLGRDKFYRPVIIFNVSKIVTVLSDSESLVQVSCYILSTIKHSMFLPYFVERWVVLMDMTNVNLLRLPVKILKEIIGISNINFCSMMNQMFIINPPFILTAGWSIIKKMMAPGQDQKIRFITTKQFGVLHDKINLDQLEQKYGGEIPNLEICWPIKNTYAFQEKQEIPLQQQNISLIQQEGQSPKDTNQSQFFSCCDNPEGFFFPSLDREYYSLDDRKHEIMDNLQQFTFQDMEPQDVNCCMGPTKCSIM